MVDGQKIWTSGPLRIKSEPTLEFASPNSVDIVGACWEFAKSIVLVGDSLAYVIDWQEGSINGVFELGFVGRSSLDIVGIELIRDGQLLLLVSTRKVLLVNADMDVMYRYEARYLLAGRPIVDRGLIRIHEYDLDGAGDNIVEEIIPIPA
jgi:hypothetical protein